MNCLYTNMVCVALYVLLMWLVIYFIFFCFIHTKSVRMYAVTEQTNHIVSIYLFKITNNLEKAPIQYIL